MSYRRLTLAAVLVASVFSLVANADVTFENDNFEMVLSDQGFWKSLFDKNSNSELCPQNKNVPFTHVGSNHPPVTLTQKGDLISFTFEKSDMTLTLKTSIEPQWIRFGVEKITGPRPKYLPLAQVPVNIIDNVGKMMNCAWNSQTAVCLAAANFQPDCAPSKTEPYAILAASSQDGPGPLHENAAVALIVSPKPEIKKVMRSLSHKYDLLINEDADGTPSKDVLGRRSYWFVMGVNEQKVDKIIECCKIANIKQVLILFSSWATSAGHIEYNTKNFPDGPESLRRFVKKFNDVGIDVGSHAFVSKVQKNDAYVTPIPDKRFWVDLPEISLALDVTIGVNSIKVAQDISQWPGSPVTKRTFWDGGVKKHQEFTLNDEIIKYQGIDPATNTFLKCQRGAYKTVAAAHKQGDKIVHWGYESSGMYIIDPESTLLDEVCDRMAKVFNECNFNMVYFDGSEDVPNTRHNYYAALVHAKALNKFKVRPFVHMGGLRAHRHWHSFTLAGTCDTYINTLYGSAAVRGESKIRKQWTVREHINRSVKRVIECHKSMISGELGWFGIWRKGIGKNYGIETDGLQFDEIEYLMVKSLAYDAPISIESGVDGIFEHPLTPQILEIIGTYQNLRTNNLVDPKVLEPLKTLNVDYAYVTTDQPGQFVKVEKLPRVARTEDIRAYAGQLSSGEAFAVIWHYEGKNIALKLPEKVADIKIYDFKGNLVKPAFENGSIVVPLNQNRLTVVFPKLSPLHVRQALAGSKI
jgi:hypothetical protein